MVVRRKKPNSQPYLEDVQTEFFERFFDTSQRHNGLSREVFHRLASRLLDMEEIERQFNVELGKLLCAKQRQTFRRYRFKFLC